MGTLYDGALLIEGGKITGVGKWQTLREQFPSLVTIDYTRDVVTPGLVDCHTHLLEFAPSSLYPITEKTHFLAGKSSCGKIVTPPGFNSRYHSTWRANLWPSRL